MMARALSGFIVKGVLMLEFIATLFRMGWLYLSWPFRLCNSYLLDDQRRLGQYLVVAGVAVCVFVAAKLLWGHVDTRPIPRHGGSLHGTDSPPVSNDAGLEPAAAEDAAN
jgi:hypothetical protein